MKSDMTVVEVSYEVANKVGGIYTVLVSKLARMLENFESYHAIGPYYPDSALAEFEPMEVPEAMKAVHSRVEKRHGIKCHYGRWLVDQKPTVTLVEPALYAGRINDIKKELWEKHGIDSLNSDSWYDGPVVWGKAAGIVLEEMLKARVFRNPVLHFHEWLSGVALLHLKSAGAKEPMVFTTHSTVLGRAMAEVGNENVHDMFDTGIRENKTIDSKKAYQYNVQSKHLLEKATAANATVFTTVSETAGNECTFVLGRKPDLILPNGLDMEKFPLMEELSELHIENRDRIRMFTMSYFAPYYEFDTKNSLFFFISGRQEIRNKGIDVFVESLGRLNQSLRKEKSKKNIVVFIWVPAHTIDRKPDVMENMTLFKNLETSVEEETEKIKDRVIESFSEGKLPGETSVFDEEFLDYMKKMKLRLIKDNKHVPPLSAYDLDAGNPIISLLESNGLLNRQEDKVKVIYYPTYLSVVDGLLNMNYYSAIIGCHLGVFPSYYESWGYTPLETAALGVQSITTDLSGFGKFINRSVGSEQYGIYVLPREGRSYEDTVSSLHDALYQVWKMSKQQRNTYKIMAKQLSALSDWKLLIDNYRKSYELALKKVYG